jgi:hypothetical protein
MRYARHGWSETHAYKAWESIRYRCQKTWHHKWHLYGAQGVAVAPAWSDSFTAWWEHVGQLSGCPYDSTGQRMVQRISLDRINPFGHYEPGNVRWATDTQQQRNRRNNSAYTNPPRRSSDEDTHPRPS